MNKNYFNIMRCCALAAVAAFATMAAHAITWEGTTNLAMTAATTVEVPAGRTNVIAVLDGAYELTKTGGGVLEIHFVANGNVGVVVEEGAVRFSNPRPDDLFAESSIHLDATDFSSMEIETVNGTNFVSMWRDTDGRNRWATNCTTSSGNRTNPENRRAFLKVDGPARRPVVNFGGLLKKSGTYSAEAQALAYGAAMTLDQRIDMVEGFSVFSDTEDYEKWNSLGISVLGMPLMCSEADGGWTRGGVTANGTTVWSQDGREQNKYLPQKAGLTNIICDLTIINNMQPKWIYIAKGFHLGNIIPAIPLPVTHLAAQNSEYGGQKIGEYVLFERELSWDERNRVSHYLKTKWFPTKLKFVQIREGAKFVVDDDITLEPGYYLDETPAVFSAGRGETVIDPLAGDNCLVRLDASVTNLMEIVQENGTNFVARWYDANGRDVCAATNMLSGKWGQRSNPERRMPYLSAGPSGTGLPSVDFGSPLITIQAKGTTELQGEAKGYGASMRFASNMSVDEFVAVVEDNDEITNQVPNKIAVSYIACESGNNSDPYYIGSNQGRRGSTTSNRKNAPLFQGVSGSNFGAAGRYYLDNASCAYNATPPLGRFYMVDASPTAPQSFNSIARYSRTDSINVTDNYGGMRFAELLLFKARLPERERDRVNRLMRAKWFGDEYVKTAHYYARLRVPVDGMMTVAHDPAVVTEELSIGGTLAVPEGLSAAAIEVTAAGAEIAAPMTLTGVAELSFTQDGNGFNTLKVTSLVLSDAGVVRLSVTDPKALRHRKVKLVDCAAVTGLLDHWRASVTGWIHGAALFLEPDGIYAELLDPGTFIMVQ